MSLEKPIENFKSITWDILIATDAVDYFQAGINAACSVRARTVEEQMKSQERKQSVQEQYFLAVHLVDKEGYHNGLMSNSVLYSHLQKLCFWTMLQYALKVELPTGE